MHDAFNKCVYFSIAMGNYWIRNRRRERIVYLPVDAEGTATPGIPITMTQFRTSESADAAIYPFNQFTVGSGASSIPVPANNSLLVIKANSSRYYQVIHARNTSGANVAFNVPGTTTNYIYNW